MKYFIFFFALAIGIAALWYSQAFIRLYWKTGKWNKVQAKVLSKEVVLNPRSNSLRSPYRLQVQYSYHINNKDYTSTKLDLVELMDGFQSYTKPAGEKRLAEIKEFITVYVNPDEPTQAVAERAGIFLFVFVFLIGFFSVLIGITKLF